MFKFLKMTDVLLIYILFLLQRTSKSEEITFGVDWFIWYGFMCRGSFVLIRVLSDFFSLVKFV